MFHFKVLNDLKPLQVEGMQKEFEMHNEEINKCLKKKSIDSVHMNELMKITASERRGKILSSNIKISEVQAMYPALKFQEWVSIIKMS